MKPPEQWREEDSDQYKRVVAREKRDARMISYSKRKGRSIFAGSGLPRAQASDILQPGLYGSKQQPGPPDAGAVAQPIEGEPPGQSDIAVSLGKKLGLSKGAPKISPGDQPFKNKK